MHETVNTVFINIATGEEIKELPSKFDREALKEKLVLSTHRAWKNSWEHYKVLKVEEQAGETVVAHVKQLRYYIAPPILFALCGLGVFIVLLAGAALWFFLG